MAATKGTGKKKGANNHNPAEEAKDRLELSRQISLVNGLGGQVGSQARLLQAFRQSVAGAAGVSAAQITAQQQSTSMNYGDLIVANTLAHAAGLKFDQIKVEHATFSWADLAEAHKVKLDALIAKLKSVQKGVDQEEKEMEKEAQERDRKEREAERKRQEEQRQRQQQMRRRRH